MGNATVSLLSGLHLQGNYKAALVTITGSSSYATNGDSVLAAELPVATVTAFISEPRTLTNGYSCAYDTSANKLKVFDAAGTEITSTTNLSAISFKGILLGKP